MKIKAEHMEHMRVQMMKSGSPPTLNSYLNQGLTEKRWRYDWLWKAGLSKWICDNIYPYANDDHIDTALRYITRSIKSTEE